MSGYGSWDSGYGYGTVDVAGGKRSRCGSWLGGHVVGLALTAFFVFATIPVWMAVLRLRSDTRRMQIQGEMEVQEANFKYLSDLGDTLSSEVYAIRSDVGSKILGSRKKSRKVAIATPTNPKLYSIQQAVMVVVNRINRIGIGLELGVFDIEDVRESSGEEIRTLIEETRNVVAAIRETDPSVYQNYFTLLDQLDAAAAHRELANVNVDA